MDIRKLQRAIIDGLEDVKAQDIVVFNTEHKSALFERVIIASGTSNRQTKALASSVRDKVRSQGGRVLSTEGADNGEWIIVDCGAAVAHILQPAIRQYYYLEELWGGKPVNMKLTSAPRGLVKASEPMDDDEVSDEPVVAPAAKAGARSGAGKAKARKAPAKTGAKAAGKAGSRTGAKAAPAKTAGRSAGGAAKTSRAGAAKAPARRPAAKTGARTAAGKTTARTAGKTAGKTAAKSATRAAGKTARKTAAKKSTGSPRRG
jgi:ribosome-associated protein